MKTSSLIVILLVSIVAISRGQPAGTGTINSSTNYTVVERGANHNVWQRTTYEQAPDGSMVPHVHRYTELATGLNHLSGDSYVPSAENILISPDGSSAAATNGQHQVYFPADIYNGVIKLVTPDGKTLESQPIGLSYFDGSNSVLLAVLTNSTGEILPADNQVMYTSAFTGLDADLLYKNTRAGLEQDVILRTQLPDPAALGLSATNTRIQILTEFLSAPQPAVTTNTVPMTTDNLENDDVNFGAMQMWPGRAFLLGTNSPSVNVVKQWLSISNRQFLVEEVPFASITNELSSLPAYQTASIQPNPPLNVVSSKRLLPAQRLVSVPNKCSMQLAQNVSSSPGLVLDYVILNSYTNNFTFRGDTTYYISGSFDLSGAGVTNTFEGGAVIKYAPGSSMWLFMSYMTLNWQASAYRPVIITAADDNSVGEVITNSTGHPTNYYANPALLFSTGGVNVHTNTLQYLRIAYANYGIQTAYSPLIIRNSQFVNVANPIKTLGNSLNLENILMHSHPTGNRKNVLA